MSLVFVVMLLVVIVSLNVTEIVVAGELNVELSVGLTEENVGAVESVEDELSEVLVELSEESSEESSEELSEELSEESPEDEVVLSVLEEELLSDFAHEETSTAMLTIKTKQFNILFILFLPSVLEKTV